MTKIINHNLFEQIKNLIDQTKNSVAIAVNSSMTMMYWHIGKLINDEILQNKRAGYGKEIVATVSQQLSWSHFLALLPLQVSLKIEFYAQMSIAQNWGVRTLREILEAKLHQAIESAKAKYMIELNQ